MCRMYWGRFCSCGMFKVLRTSTTVMTALKTFLQTCQACVLGGHNTVQAHKHCIVCLSPGRVQSVALRMISDRESDIERFHPQEYWTISVVFVTPDGISFTARLTAVDGQKLGQLSISDQQAAQQMVDRIRTSGTDRSSIMHSDATRNTDCAPVVASMTSL